MSDYWKCLAEISLAIALLCLILLVGVTVNSVILARDYRRALNALFATQRINRGRERYNKPPPPPPTNLYTVVEMVETPL